MKKVFRVSTVPVSLLSLLKGQLKMLAEHYEVVGVSSSGEELDALAEQEGIDVIAVDMERKISILKDVKSLFKMIALLRREKPDMIHSITPKAGLISMLAAKIAGVPVRVHTFTGLIFPTSKGIKKQILILMDRLTCLCATHIYPEGQGVKKDLQNYKITSKPLNIIANGNVNGIDTTRFNPDGFEGPSPEVFRFCFVGRLVGDKGINELVGAFDKLSDKYPHTELILVGPYETELDPLQPSTIDKINTNKAIKAVGYQSDVRGFMAKSNIFVFPSYREGFPNVVLQAGAMGMAQIVTNISGCNEIIIDGENGVIIPPRDEQALYEKMEYMLENKEQVAAMAACAREKIVSRYEQKYLWSELLKEYKKLLGE